MLEEISIQRDNVLLFISHSYIHHHPQFSVSFERNKDVVAAVRCLLRLESEKHFAVDDSWMFELVCFAEFSRLALANV